MLQTIQMPKLSPTMTDGVIAKWHKKVGDHVDAGDVLLEIGTDKATVEHSALDNGWVREILASEGSTVEVGKDIALLTDEENEIYTKTTPTKEAMKAEIPTQKIEPKPIEKQPQDHIIASPLAKKLAKESGLDLATIHGSGPHGRIMSRDLPKTIPTAVQTDVIKIPLSPMRKVISERLTYSKTHIPHFYLTLNCDVSDLIHMREQLKEEKYTLTVTDFIVRAVALSLMEHPTIRSCYDEKEQVILQYPHADISIAVSVEGGLVTPILFNAEEKPIQALSQELKKLAEKARSGKLSPKEYTGGCFTITNLGMFGIDEFKAIVNPPQCAILAVGVATEELKMVQGQVVSRKILKLSLSVDHRVVDGEVAASFVQSIRKYLEKPALLLV